MGIHEALKRCFSLRTHGSQQDTGLCRVLSPLCEARLVLGPLPGGVAPAHQPGHLQPRDSSGSLTHLPPGHLPQSG